MAVSSDDLVVSVRIDAETLLHLGELNQLWPGLSVSEIVRRCIVSTAAAERQRFYRQSLDAGERCSACRQPIPGQCLVTAADGVVAGVGLELTAAQTARWETLPGDPVSQCFQCGIPIGLRRKEV